MTVDEEQGVTTREAFAHGMTASGMPANGVPKTAAPSDDMLPTRAGPIVTDHVVQVADSQLFVRRWRAANQGRDAASILLLHESLGSVELWREFPLRLAEATGRDVIAYDRAGFGRSSARHDRLPLTLSFIADEVHGVRALCAHFSLGPIIPFGHSVGGAMAIHVAASGDVHCAGVITEGAQACIEPRTRAGVAAARERFADPSQLARIARWHGEKARWVVDAWTETWLSPEFATWSLDDVLPRVTCPVLAIHGTDDEFGSVAFARRIADGAGAGSGAGADGQPPGRALIIDGCGHVPHREREQAVLQAVASFCAPLR